MKTWLITGCSTGFGLRLAERAAARGDRVLATARRPETLAGLAARHEGRIVPHALDVTDASAIAGAVATAERAFGGLDILVNNAGYGLFGAIEEGEPAEYRPMFEANVFGLIELTRAALPLLRRGDANRRATIVNLSSGAGIRGSAGTGYYNASKFAVEGLSEALAEEVAPFGIRVIIVEPGPFRTEFLGRSITVAAREMPEYAETAGKRRAYRTENDDRQPGDPDKAVQIMLDAIDSATPPLHLPLGPVAHAIADAKLKSFRADIDAWRDRSIATDFDPAS